jgi:hypothetical protein
MEVVDAFNNQPRPQERERERRRKAGHLPFVVNISLCRGARGEIA